MAKLFGTDGIRGEANSHSMNTELGVALGRAAGYYVRNSSELPQIVIGKDTRLSGYMLETAIASGITSMGLSVVKTGPLPTPGVSFICRSMRARMGIMISASHNPASQNGIKLFGEDGFKLSKAQENEVEELMLGKTVKKHLAKPNSVGKIKQIHDASGRYVQYLKERFPYKLTLKGLKIAIDTANGSAYSVAPAVFSELGAEISVSNGKPNGLNINVDCGALHPEKICERTMAERANIGVTLDGDADRVLLSDEKGNLVDGDAILYICARHIASKGHLEHPTVVGTVMTNQALEVALNKIGISLVRTDVGDQQVISYMKEHKIILGGEPCGHLVFLHHSCTGDGILAALRVLSIMQQKGKPLSELVKPYKPFPQKTINIPVKEKIAFDKNREVSKTKKEIEKELGKGGRLLLRYSGTEMIARVMVESNDKKLSNDLAEKLADKIRKNLA